MPLETRPLQPHFGSEVLDVDLSDLDEARYREILRAWQEQPLLLFRRQVLSEGELVAFSERFGRMFVVPNYLNSRAHPEVMYVSNLLTQTGRRIGSLASSELNWHSDQSYQPQPATGSIFYAVEMPAGMGRTSWCNGELAWTLLPADLQTELEGLQGESRYNGYEREQISEEEKQALREKYPPVRHPLVLTHPATGRRTLYLDISTTYAIVGLPEARSRALLKELAAVMTRPECVYQHEWRMGDVMLWDNGRTCHRREPIDPDVPRLAKRTTIYLRPGEFPVPA
jgi:alpha-ketoglutarate-dependent taurine dioxygenase